MKRSIQQILFVGLIAGLILSGCSGSSTSQPTASNTNQTQAADYTVLPEDTPLVTVGIWKTDDCSGDPAMILAFPTNYADQQCYAWPGNSGENSATDFNCGDDSFSYTQWTTLTCSGGHNPEGTDKIVYTNQCEQDVPPTIYSRIIDFSGCTAESRADSTPDTPLPKSETTEIVNDSADSCTFPLVRLQTGQDAECSGGNIHAWPVGLESDDCHGWASYDTDGKLHENSANNITCNGDGTFSFTQFAGTLNCEGGRSGVTKTYALNSCEQDIPPTLYTQAIDLTCCTNPDSPECQVGLPAVSVQETASTIYLNGQVCSEE